MSDFLPDAYDRFVKLGIAIGALAEGAVRSTARNVRAVGDTDRRDPSDGDARHIYGRVSGLAPILFQTTPEDGGTRTR